MKFSEKLKQDNPNMSEEELVEAMRANCPDAFGYEDNTTCTNETGVKDECRACWNREMPGTEQHDEIQERLELIEELKQVEYNKGLNDAWKVFAHVQSGNLSISQIKEVWGIDELEFANCFTEIFTPQEALAKLKAYESKIEVGDVVTYAGEKGLVLDIKGSKVVVLTDDGYVQEWYECDVEKTGKHIDIQNILEQIGE